MIQYRVVAIAKEVAEKVRDTLKSPQLWTSCACRSRERLWPLPFLPPDIP